MTRRLVALAGALTALTAAQARAHVGSPDVFHEGNAGPYRVLVTVRPPEVIPGVADVELRVLNAEASEVRIVPLPLNKEGVKRAPTPDVAARDNHDPTSFSGHLWLMR